VSTWCSPTATGPQVGNLLVKNELAAAVVPPVPLDWCGAQTQGTIGFLMLNALDRSLAARGVDRDVAVVVTRTRVDGDDPGFQKPSKPVGRFLPEGEAKVLMEHGQTWEDRGARGWRRVVASPEPLEVLDAPAVRAAGRGFVVVAAGGAASPFARRPTAPRRCRGGHRQGPPRAARRATSAPTCSSSPPTSSRGARFRHSDARPLGRSTPPSCGYAAAGQFAGGSMGPKVEAVVRFVERAAAGRHHSLDASRP
jgi:carbamate kinase